MNTDALKMLDGSKKYFFLDVESMGLHGDPFAVGVVITDEEGKLLDEFCWSIHRKLVNGSPIDREWVEKNVPNLDTTHVSLTEMLKEFWNTWKMWKSVGTIMVTDCPWPVESRFLNMCVNMDQDKWSGPYPLVDIGSMLLAKGTDPTSKLPRLDSELPEHNPLNDARQTKRIFFELLKG